MGATILRVRELQPGVVHLRLVGLQRTLVLLHQRFLRRHLLLGDQAFARETLVAGEVALRRSSAARGSPRAAPAPATAAPGTAAGRFRRAGRPAETCCPSVNSTRTSSPSSRLRTVTVLSGVTVPSARTSTSMVGLLHGHDAHRTRSGSDRPPAEAPARSARWRGSRPSTNTRQRRRQEAGSPRSTGGHWKCGGSGCSNGLRAGHHGEKK